MDWIRRLLRRQRRRHSSWPACCRRRRPACLGCSACSWATMWASSCRRSWSRLSIWTFSFSSYSASIRWSAWVGRRRRRQRAELGTDCGWRSWLCSRWALVGRLHDMRNREIPFNSNRPNDQSNRLKEFLTNMADVYSTLFVMSVPMHRPIST